jgi:magnesium chelatase subunit D
VDTRRVKVQPLTQFPFSAVVAMDDMRLALILNAVSPQIGGVLVRGEKGTAKSTAVRALTAVLPPVDVVAGCRFSCSPEAPDPECPDGPHSPGAASSPGLRAQRRPARLVELPVGATEDRLTGSLDIGRALTEGVTSFQPGLLAAAHRGVLYVDEVNLLHDHLVDLLLDAAALGTNYVERDGVSVRHEARFLLVGTMNPEEGELRPQLLDRFGLTVEAAAPRDPASRAEVVRRRLAFDAGPDAFAARFAGQEAELAAAIAAARRRLPAVILDDEALERIATVCASFDVDGLRADIVIARTAAAHAAWRSVSEGSSAAEVGREDIRVAARLALPHRRRRNPFDAPGLDEDQLDNALGEPDEEPEPDPPNGGGPGPDNDGPDNNGPDNNGPGNGAQGSSAQGSSAQDGSAQDGSAQDGSGQDAGQTEPAGDDERRQAPVGQAAGRESVAPSGATFRARRLEVPVKGEGAAGRRSRAATTAGRSVGARPPLPGQGPLDVHLAATLVASAPHQRRRGRTGPGLLLEAADLREHRREGRESNLVLFTVDASGSMAARRRMEAVKGAVLSLLLDAYQRRDKVGLICFRGAGAEVLLPPTSSVDTAARRLESMPAGGRTPLAAGLAEAHATLRRERLRDPRRRPLLVVVTDGRHTAGGDPGIAAAGLRRDGIAAVLVDCESGPVRLGLAAGLAQALGAEYLSLASLSAGDSPAGGRAGMSLSGEKLADSVRGWRAGQDGQARPVSRKVA